MKSAAVILFAGAAMAAYPVQSSSETYAVTTSSSAPVYQTYTTSESESECSDEPTSYPVTEHSTTKYPTTTEHSTTKYPTTTAYPTTSYPVPPVSYPVVVPPPVSYPVYNTTTTESECSEESSYPATQPPPPVTYPTYTQTTMETYPTGGSTVVIPVPGGNYTTTHGNAPTYPTGGNTVVPPTHVPTTIAPSGTAPGGNTVVPPTQVPSNGPSGTAPGSTAPPTTSIPTAGAAANSVGLLAVLGAFAAYLL